MYKYPVHNPNRYWLNWV